MPKIQKAAPEGEMPIVYDSLKPADKDKSGGLSKAELEKMPIPDVGSTFMASNPAKRYSLDSPTVSNAYAAKILGQLDPRTRVHTLWELADKDHSFDSQPSTIVNLIRPVASQNIQELTNALVSENRFGDPRGYRTYDLLTTLGPDLKARIMANIEKIDPDFANRIKKFDVPPKSSYGRELLEPRFQIEPRDRQILPFSWDLPPHTFDDTNPPIEPHQPAPQLQPERPDTKKYPELLFGPLLRQLHPSKPEKSPQEIFEENCKKNGQICA